MRERFVEKRFSAGSLQMISAANEIIEEYRQLGFVLTLRQLYYQFVARALIPNRQSEYKRLGSVINDGRLAGLIDWDMIEDRTRNLETLPCWDDPQSLILIAAKEYRSDIWAKQDWRVEIWIEKEALIGVIEPVSNEFRVPYFACRGYSSQSEQWRAGRRFRQFLVRDRQRILILHLGDHDPSGLDMTRDNDDRLRMFSRASGADIEVRRLALNMDQVQQYNPPPNPAKTTDARFESYAREYGDESWELDALNPQVIDRLIRDELAGIIVPDRWAEVVEEEEAARQVMTAIATDWEDLSEQYQ